MSVGFQNRKKAIRRVKARAFRDARELADSVLSEETWMAHPNVVAGIPSSRIDAWIVRLARRRLSLIMGVFDDVPFFRNVFTLRLVSKRIHFGEFCSAWRLLWRFLKARFLKGGAVSGYND